MQLLILRYPPACYSFSMKKRRRSRDPKTSDLNDRFESRLDIETSWSDHVADFLTSGIGTISFLIANAVFFGVWLAVNLGLTPLAVFDPYPFGMLTMIVSLEAIFLSTIVLISQNRLGSIADLRQQMDFEIDVRTEQEIDKILDILDGMRHHMGIHKSDEELEAMKQRTNLDTIRRTIESSEQHHNYPH